MHFNANNIEIGVMHALYTMHILFKYFEIIVMHALFCAHIIRPTGM